ncbi:hypothetical protein NBRC116591_29490 [Sessilibacter corallicola]|uniref:Site-specific DNA-methyltransferase (adenine-specific) n=1 Tax=Sessilibacter corallicola TaxID=2904075 RepID=A0ABQ0ABV6_9GAMM
MAIKKDTLALTLECLFKIAAAINSEQAETEDQYEAYTNNGLPFKA